MWQLFGIALHFDILLTGNPAWSVEEGVSDILRFGHVPLCPGLTETCLLQWRWEPRKRSGCLWIPDRGSNAVLEDVRVCCIAALLSCRHCSGHIRPLVQQTLATRDAADLQKAGRKPALQRSRCWAACRCFVLLGLVPRCGFWNYGTFNFFLSIS